MKTIFLILGVMGTCALCAGPRIADASVTVRQLADRQLEVVYDLEGEDAIVTLQAYTNGVALPGSCLRTLSGDVSRVVVAGQGRKAYWQPRRDFSNQVLTNGELSVKLTCWSRLTPPDYMLVDLTAFNRRYYYADADSLPFGHPTNNVDYKTTHLVMRKIPASGVRFNMGSLTDTDGRATSRVVALSDDYYMAIFETTEGQVKTLQNGTYWKTNHDNVSDVTRLDEHPVGRVNFNSIRSSWPENGHKNIGNGLLAKLRTRTGIAGFDLPTAAQWEFACRAGGYGVRNVEGVPTSAFAWYGQSSTTTPILCHPVGQLLPNAWGLYDMHGNIEEWVLDSWTKSYDGTVEYRDPIGANTTTGAHTDRMVKGGGAHRDEASMVSSFCTEWWSDRSETSATVTEVLGFRVICPVLPESVGVPSMAVDQAE